uniref:Uncharacterized protein n=1 Tax=Anguilla anguilla TaxID=7936 RepID=A0A0E9PZB7_ANGAN
MLSNVEMSDSLFTVGYTYGNGP